MRKILIACALSQALVMSAAADPPGSRRPGNAQAETTCSDLVRLWQAGLPSASTMGNLDPNTESACEKLDYLVPPFASAKHVLPSGKELSSRVPNTAVCLVSARDCFCR
jgi:hypothetical protein